MSISKKWKKYITLGVMLFLFPLGCLLLFGKVAKHHFKTLSYYEPKAAQALESSNYTLPPFTFIDQFDHSFSSSELVGKIWLAAFYSLNDPHISKITERLLNINFKYRNETEIRIVVFSTDCERDTPALLQQYTQQLTRYNADINKWTFLTGDQHTMRSLFASGFFIEDLSNEAIFRLVDPQGHIRGQYGNTEYHILNAIEDIALLKKEIDIEKYNEEKKLENTP